MFEKLLPMFFSILYFQYNGGSGGLFCFLFFTFQSIPKRFTFSTLVGPFFFFPFFLLRPTPKQESKQKKKDTKSKLKQNLSYHSLLSPQNCMFLCKTFFSPFPSFSHRHQLPVAQAKRSKVCAHFYSSGDSGSQLHLQRWAAVFLGAGTLR